jgi:hypothetical protein
MAGKPGREFPSNLYGMGRAMDDDDAVVVVVVVVAVAVVIVVMFPTRNRNNSVGPAGISRVRHTCSMWFFDIFHNVTEVSFGFFVCKDCVRAKPVLLAR